ncbi:phytoene desaturase family protein [Flavobacterium rhizosphaerae]|uniref:NAD(P)/FAD-dependent oxidoreductase n=1 Tax=Flavobacterium rhizosphaerae TaxID=3163298 RepID=A0ABW8YWI8_9FLAO
MEAVDAIIIGSGAGGLATAICLARAGQKVLVLEQHYVPGGWCHSFMLNGQRFSPGVHYIGLADDGQATSQLYKGLGIANELVFFRMNKHAFEHCCIGDKKIDLPAGFNAMGDALAKHFPQEKGKIKKYLQLVDKVNTQLQYMPTIRGLRQTLTAPFKTAAFVHHAPYRLKKIIGRYIKDPLLKAVLNIQCGDHGLPPEKAHFVVHCAVMAHYAEGGFYPMGGGGGLVKAMTNVLKKHGGEVRVSTRVHKIIVQNNTAVGVEIEDGQKLYAKTIISNADPSITYFNLIGREHLGKKLLKKLDSTRYSVTSLILFLTLEMDVTAAGIDSGNFWIYRDEDVDNLFKELTHEDVTAGEEFPAIFMSCTTLKDPVSYNGKYHNLELVTYIDYDKLPEFKGEEDYHCDAYKQFKQKVISKFMNTAERMIPGAKKATVQVELGTPKTNQFYINSTKGNVYGAEKTLFNMGPFSFKNKTEINNLYLCGASTLSHGVAGATYSGIETAAKLLGCRKEDLLLPDESQQLRIIDAEDKQGWPQWLLKKRDDKVRNFKEIKL